MQITRPRSQRPAFLTNSPDGFEMVIYLLLSLLSFLTHSTDLNHFTTLVECYSIHHLTHIT